MALMAVIAIMACYRMAWLSIINVSSPTVRYAAQLSDYGRYVINVSSKTPAVTRCLPAIR